MASKHLYFVAKVLYAEKTGEELNDIAMSRVHEVCGVSRQTVVNWKASNVAPRKSIIDRFCSTTKISRDLIDAVMSLPWDIDVNEMDFCSAIKNRDVSYIKRLGFSPNFLPTQLISQIEELSPDHLVKKLWEYRNKGDDFLPPVDRFIFFAGSARILYQDLIEWIESKPKDVKVSIDYLTSIMDNLQIPVQDRGWFFMRPERDVKNRGTVNSLKEIRVQAS
ncbi:MAG: hypothetical protein ACP5VS_18415 [Desulfomonilaceae bacterium]